MLFGGCAEKARSIEQWSDGGEVGGRIGFDRKVGVLLKKMLDGFFAFFGCIGANSIDQAPVGFEGESELVKQLSLCLRELLDILECAAVADLRVFPKRSKAGTGGITENAVKAVFGEGLGQIGLADADVFDVEAFTDFLDQVQLVGVSIDGGDLGLWGKRSEVGGFSAGGGASIKDALVGLGFEQVGDTLGCFVLDDERLGKFFE